MSWHYLNNKLSPGFVSLFSGRMLQMAANGLVGLFLPVYFFIHFDYSIFWVLIWYVIGYLVYALLLPLSAQLLNNFGLRRALRVSVFFDALFFVFIILIPQNVLLYSILALLAATVNRILFWLPFHVDFAKFTDSSDRGKEVSLIWAAKSFLKVVLPIVAGLLIVKFGFTVVYLIAIVLYIAPIIPYMMLPRTHEKYSWSYFGTWKRFFKKKNRRLVIANMANGAETAMAFIIWPIFIWQLLKGDFVSVGIVSSLIIFVGVVLQLAAGKYTDKFSKHKILHWGSVFYALGWLMKVFVLTGWHIFIVGTYHQFAQIFKDTPFDALIYEYLADRGHYVDEYTVIKELGIQVGRVIVLGLALLVSLSLGLNWTFALAALVTLFVNLL